MTNDFAALAALLVAVSTARGVLEASWSSPDLDAPVAAHQTLVAAWAAYDQAYARLAALARAK